MAQASVLKFPETGSFEPIDFLSSADDPEAAAAISEFVVDQMERSFEQAVRRGINPYEYAENALEIAMLNMLRAMGCSPAALTDLTRVISERLIGLQQVLSNASPAERARLSQLDFF